MADEFNFTSGVPVADIGVPGRNLPAFGQVGALRRSMAQMQIEAMRWGMHEKAYNMQTAIRTREGMAKIGEVIANGSFDDPKTLQSALGIAAQYGIETELLDPIMRRFNSASEYGKRMELLDKEYKLRMQLAEQESLGRQETERIRQREITDRERMRQDEMNRRQGEKIAAAKEAYEARLKFARESLKNDPMMDAKERLFSAKAQAIVRDEWTSDTPQEIQKKIDDAFTEVFGSQLGGGTNAPATADPAAPPASNRRKFNPVTNMLE